MSSATTLRRVILLGVFVPLLAAGLRAEPLGSIPNPRVRNGNWVTDMPGVLRADTVDRLKAAIRDVERTHGVEMAVVVVGSLDGLSVEEEAVKLFELWGIGKKKSDNGLLLLWSTGDRRVRLEVGYGLEGVLPDGKVGAILDQYVMPRFRAGQFDEGLLAGVDAILAVARKEPVPLDSARSQSYEPHSLGTIAAIIGLVSAIPITIASFFGLRIWRRRRPRRCPACQMPMTRLDELADDALLEEGQQAEERIGSVDYDVWKCGSCGHHYTLRYPKAFSSFGQCPQCHNRTKSSHQTVLSAATTISAGAAQVLETCAFCSFHHEYTTVLPQLQSGSSGFGDSSGGSSGGGSSSFGGGSSGGGGASRGY